MTNLYIEIFEVKAKKKKIIIIITISFLPPGLWIRYVNDTFVVIEKDRAQQFTDQLRGVEWVRGLFLFPLVLGKM